MTDRERKEAEKNMNSYTQCINDNLDEFMEKLQKDDEKTKKYQHENEDYFLRNIFIISIILCILTFSPVALLIFVVAYLLTSKF